jgi:hypothetical protein
VLCCLILLLPGHLLAQETLPRWSLVPQLRVGSIDGPDALEAMGEIVVSPRSGNIFVSEASQRILVFSADGRRLRQFGREGSGPGEFRNLQDIYWSDGRIVATDARVNRLTSFTEEGDVIAADLIESGPLPGVSGGAAPAAPLGRGFFLGKLTEERPDGNELRGHVLLVRSDGEGRDSILDSFPTPSRYFRAGQGGLIGVPAPGGQYGVDPRGRQVVVVHQADPEAGRDAAFRIRKISADGHLVFSRKYTYTPIPRPPGYVREFVEDRRDGVKAIGLSTAEAERIVDRYAPRFLNPVREVRVGVDGSIWLKREEEQGDLVWWNVLDSRGEPLANLRLSSRARIRHVDGDTVWGMETDDLGVYYLMKYRVVR